MVEMILKSYMEIRGLAKPKTNGGRKEHQNGKEKRKNLQRGDNGLIDERRFNGLLDRLIGICVVVPAD